MASASRKVARRSRVIFSQNANRQARARERMLLKNFRGQAEFPADAANFVLEKIAQGLNEGEWHFFREAHQRCDAF